MQDSINMQEDLTVSCERYL